MCFQASYFYQKKFVDMWGFALKGMNEGYCSGLATTNQTQTLRYFPLVLPIQ